MIIEQGVFIFTITYLHAFLTIISYSPAIVYKEKKFTDRATIQVEIEDWRKGP